MFISTTLLRALSHRLLARLLLNLRAFSPVLSSSLRSRRSLSLSLSFSPSRLSTLHGTKYEIHRCAQKLPLCLAAAHSLARSRISSLRNFFDSSIGYRVGGRGEERSHAFHGWPRFEDDTAALEKSCNARARTFCIEGCIFRFSNPTASSFFLPLMASLPPSSILVAVVNRCWKSAGGPTNAVSEIRMGARQKKVVRV